MSALVWQARTSEAPAPTALVAAAAPARLLLARFLAGPDAALASLSAVVTRDLLVLIAQADELPWQDGARYASPADSAADLWLPTHVEPTMPADLLHRALQARSKRTPLLLWNEPPQLLPLDRATPLTHALCAWLLGALDQ